MEMRLYLLVFLVFDWSLLLLILADIGLCLLALDYLKPCNNAGCEGIAYVSGSGFHSFKSTFTYLTTSLYVYNTVSST
jgi:hypothetical protein